MCFYDLHTFTIPRSDLQKLLAIGWLSRNLVKFTCLEPFYLCSHGWMSWPLVFIICGVFLSTALAHGHVNLSGHLRLNSKPSIPSRDWRKPSGVMPARPQSEHVPFTPDYLCWEVGIDHLKERTAPTSKSHRWEKEPVLARAHTRRRPNAAWPQPPV